VNGGWLNRRARDLLLVVGLLAVVLRVMLVAYAPPYGYVWDFYQEGVDWLYVHGHLPRSSDCWQCYHPPLFYWLGWPFYALGAHVGAGNVNASWRMLAGESLLSVAILVYYAVRLLRLIGCRRGSLAAAVCLLLSIPLLFIVSDGPDADVVVGAVLAGFVFHVTRVFGGRSRVASRDALGLGVLVGLAIATKFTGLVAVASVGVLLGLRLVDGRDRAATLRAGAIIVVTASMLGAWKYVDNYERYGTPLFANGSAAAGFTATARPSHVYDFTSFRLIDVAGLFGPGAPAGQLTDFPVYQSVLTSLHAQVWSDMSLFTVRGRHGDPARTYPTRRVPRSLAMLVVVLGLVPEGLAVLGLVVSARRRLVRPMLIVGLLTIGMYVWWFLPQARWGLKAKYLLALLPIGVAFGAIGQAWLVRRAPWAAVVTAALLIGLAVASHAYMLVFAVAR
jgi:4-amino-4-deoxy-L-arabinose transferase-like glycosyltransferase